MAHGVKLEIAERDLLHLAVGRMVVDPVFVAAETVARMQHRWMLVGGFRQLIQPAARQRPEAMEMRLEPPKIVRRQIELQQITQAAVDQVEVLTGAVRRDAIGAVAEVRRCCNVERCRSVRRVHV